MPWVHSGAAASARRIRQRLTAGGGRALSRLREDFWPLFQGALAGTIAWWIALRLAGHPQPFFAPIAAVIALNANRGKRGTNAVNLIVGVLLGIVVGEAALLVLGTGFAAMGIATLVAMAIALACDGSRLVIAQGAVGAILTVAGGQPEFGPERIMDALIGAGVALVFSQLLFPAQPIDLLRRAETDVLSAMAAALEHVSHALDHGDDREAEEAIGDLRSLRDKLTDLADTRKDSSRTARHAPVWWWRSAPIVQESENAGQLDLLNNSILVLARSVRSLPSEDRPSFAPVITRIAEVIRTLAADPGDRATRQQAAEGALASFQELEAGEDDSPARRQIHASVRLAAIDLLVFAGVESAQAAALIETHDAEVDVPDPPRVSFFPFRFRWRRRKK
ncbi:FUSC family protein [Brevibacterium sp.]|uniref:FUSC family protein n=1 Tax=Brevibacterium sp. TaxID=1701 RepID=UPI0028123F55|nr:FUSC family protein [Brevibacterium sp.]